MASKAKEQVMWAVYWGNLPVAIGRTRKQAIEKFTDSLAWWRFTQKMHNVRCVKVRVVPVEDKERSKP